MSKIFELYGHRLDRWNEAASKNREKAWCPFMDSECDGGGNRYLSSLNMAGNPSFQKYFPGKSIVQAGVCSLRLNEADSPWIVCPRRLLSLKSSASVVHQSSVRSDLAKRCELSADQRYRVWAEVKIKVGTQTDEDKEKSFDYTFDYVIAGATRKRISEVARTIGESERRATAIAEARGYTIAQRDGERWIDDFPGGPIVIVEIMTSSTSGGDKNKRTQVAMACEDAVIDPSKHNGPGINYRQVWARMVSQLIVKSQVGLTWGGKTIWLVQDVLADYISKSTALDLAKYTSEHSSEVNILAFGYGNVDSPAGPSIIELKESKFYSGPISGPTDSENTGFIEIVKIGAAPAVDQLWRALFKKQSCGYFTG